MKKILFLICLLFLSTTIIARSTMNYTDKKINGAFGLKLGEALTDSLTTKISAKKYILSESKQEDENTEYEVIPPEPFSKFQRYFITVCDKNKKIIAIKAFFKSDNYAETYNLLQFTTQLIINKYGTFEYGNQYSEDGISSSALIVEKNLSGKGILIWCKQNTLGITYMDFSLFKRQNDENKKNEDGYNL